MTERSHETGHPELVLITHEFDPFHGGVATYAAELAAALHRAGHAIEVWAPDYGGRAASGGAAFPVRRLRAGGSLRFPHMVQFTTQLIVRRRQWEHSTVLLASVGAHMAFLVLAPLGLVRCKRVISLLHGSEVLRFGRNPFWHFLARRFYPRVGRVITVSKYTKSLIDQSFLSPWAGSVAIAPPACSTAAAQTVPASAPGHGKIRILTLARIHPRKGQLDTARALTLLPAPVRANIVYQIGGAGDERSMRQVERLCLDAGIEFQHLGPVRPDALAATYAQCDIYAMTSRSLPQSVEGFGITYLEAGFHGKPVIGYDTGGVSEAVLDGQTGLLVKEGELSALSTAFARLISDPDLRQQLGEAGRSHAAQFSWDTTARVFLE